MSYNNGSVFSTFDQWHGTNCPSKDRGGWWYGACGYTNLNGVYVTPGTISSYNMGEGGMIHYAWRASHSLKTSEMKLRRK